MNAGSRLAIGTTALAIVASALIGGARIAAADSAQAAAGASFSVLSGRCSAARDNYGTFRVYFYQRGRYDVFNRFNYQLAGPGLRNKNNVEIWIRERHSRAVLHHWKSKDNVHRGHGGIPLNWRVPRKENVVVVVKFTFDRRGWDPSCADVTATV
ncbi:hypothetical protein [Nonomuraea sp. NPDC049480]|uniref:hypothetical protein n=1 Tax=Nonomuraea sp. NPDC049480 TaxID=3364353 RepID=UPI00379A40A2